MSIHIFRQCTSANMLITFNERIRRCLRNGFCLPDASPGRVTLSHFMTRPSQDRRNYREDELILESAILVVR